MADLFHSSANNITTAALPGPFANVFGSPTIGVGDGPQGINTIHCNGVTNGVFLPNIGININGSGLIIGCGVNSTAPVAQYACFFQIGGTGTNFTVCCQVLPDGAIQLGIAGGTFLSSPSGRFTFGNRHEVELLISSFATSNSCTVYLDGVAVTNLTGVTLPGLTTLGDGATIHTVLMGGTTQGAGSGTTMIMDSYYAFDTSGSFCNAPVGPAISVPMIPNGVGQESQWTPNGAGTGWQCISEIPPDGDTTYISDNTPGDEEACTLSAASGISGVYAVAVVCDQRQDTSGGGRTIQLGLGNGTTRSYGSAWGLGTTYKMNTTTFSENPFTSAAWMLSDLTALQVAAKLAS